MVIRLTRSREPRILKYILPGSGTVYVIDLEVVTVTIATTGDVPEVVFEYLKSRYRKNVYFTEPDQRPSTKRRAEVVIVNRNDLVITAYGSREAVYEIARHLKAFFE